MNRMIGLFMDYCHSKQLRPRTLLSYEQALKLFAVWLKESEGVEGYRIKKKSGGKTQMKDTYMLITDRIIAELESGTVPWRKP